MALNDELTRIQLEIETLIGATGDLDKAEDIINYAPGFTSEERSALWLYAWSLLPQSRQLQEARAHMQRLVEAAG